MTTELEEMWGGDMHAMVAGAYWRPGVTGGYLSVTRFMDPGVTVDG